MSFPTLFGASILQPAFLLAWVTVLAFILAKAEIQVEGATGWAASLPTWRVERHWLLDVFWGGRPLTGYHTWIFSFIFAVFHLPAVATSTWSLAFEIRILSCLALFWLLEDLFWFVLNPAFGFSRLKPEHAPWHPRWIFGLPVDYWIFAVLGAAGFASSYLEL